VKASLSITFIALWGPLMSLALTGYDSKEIYDAKVEKYAVMFCAGVWGVDHRLPQPDCEKRRGPEIGFNP